MVEVLAAQVFCPHNELSDFLLPLELWLLIRRTVSFYHSIVGRCLDAVPPHVLSLAPVVLFCATQLRLHGLLSVLDPAAICVSCSWLWRIHGYGDLL